MKNNNLFLLTQKVVNSINQFRKVTNEWGKGDELYDRIYMDNIMSQITKNFPDNRSLRIFDGGCGTGRFSIALAQIGHDVTGTDIHGPSIDAAIFEAKRVDVTLSLIKKDLLQCLIETESNYYDVAICLEVLGACVQYQDILKEFYRVVKDEGVFIASFRPKYYFITTLLRQKQYKKALYVAENSEGLLKIASIPTYYNWQTLKEIYQLYESNGFEIINVVPIGMFSGHDIDGMAAVANVENITNEIVISALYKLETTKFDDYLAVGKFILITGKKTAH